jgi:hypothetical protein
MSFGGYGRSPEQVQYENGQLYDFNKIAKRYEDTVPLRGKRKALNIRPHGERNRDWERIVKVNDQEYYVSNNGYSFYEKSGLPPNRAITFKRNDDGTELVIVHTPRAYWGDKAEDRERLIPKQLGVPSSFFFYDRNLPVGLGITKYYSKNYLYVQNSDTAGDISYYTLEMGDVHLTRQVGDKFFKPLIVHREVHRSLDRKKTKAIREELKPFVEYVRVMLPLVEADRHGMYTRPMTWAYTTHREGSYISGNLANECFGKGWRGMFTGEPNEFTFKLVQYYKYMCNRTVYNYDTRQQDLIEATPEQVAKYIAKEVYEREKPLHEEAVELGKRTFDKYRNW